jgi:hypothetical protein
MVDAPLKQLVCLSGRHACDQPEQISGGWRCRKFGKRIPVAVLAAKPKSIPVARTEPLPAIATRHLIYHVYPNLSRDVWRRNCRQLRRRRDLFNGRCIFAVALGPETHTLDEVQAKLNWPGAEWLPLANDRTLQDTASFLPLLTAIETTDPHAAVFYGHTKGTWSTAGDPKGIEFWRNAMYANLLDRWPEVGESLRFHAAVGTNKFTWECRPGFPSGYDPLGHWMFAGAFFWFRADLVFSHPRWRNVAQDKFGGEGWLAELFPASEGRSMFQPWPEESRPGNSYDPATYRHPIADE